MGSGVSRVVNVESNRSTLEIGNQENVNADVADAYYGAIDSIWIRTKRYYVSKRKKTMKTRDLLSNYKI